MNAEAHDRTVFIGASCFADAQSAIELSALLAESINAVLRAYLFEDEAFYQCAAFPFSKAIRIGSSFQTVTPDTMMAAFKSDADAYRQTLEAVAARKALNWTFERRRGEISRITEAGYQAGDLIVLGYQQLRKVRGEILVLESANDLDVSLIDLADKISRAVSAPLHIALFPKSVEETLLVSPGSEKMLRGIAEKISIVKGDQALQEFIENIQGRSPTAIIASKAVVERIGARRLLEAGRCPLVIAAD